MLNRNAKLNLTIFQRLSLGYLAILIVVICLSGYSIWKLSQLNQIARSLSSVDIETIRTANNTKDALLSLAANGEKFIVSRDKDFFQQFKLAEEFMNTNMRLMDEVLSDQINKQTFIVFRDRYKTYLADTKKEFQWISNQKTYDAYALRQRKTKRLNELITDLDKIIRMVRGDMQKKIRTANTIGNEAFHFTIFATLTAIAMALLIAFFNARNINDPVVSLMKGTQRIAKGEFDIPLDISSPPEIKALAESFNRMCARLKEVDQLKADFIARMSHELRTPLASIREATSLLLTDRIASSSVSRNNLLIIIREECERLIRSVNSILDLSRMESGMMDFQMEKCSLPPLLKKNITRLQPIASKKGIHLRVKIPPDLPVVFADWEKLDQVVGNLLGNALKYTPPGGQITVSAAPKTQSTDVQNPQEMVEVCIADTGCGIAEQDMTTIFEKFRKVKGKGSGLGLAIARHITLAHGGDIWVKSRPGKGSAFYFTLPAV